ncbi:hypothetical protein [Merismopedia glauca]|uniref:Uncharacterized protein n=1 Tax=Merismopedia glauca CCAP 1448/3 TaxID=1296344 RepID=A0A2T1BXD4_9CYAN|nr:hypothetical protein [Merismopedia glauca]PSB00675.1 hypothetical protein C7B64_22275 [Merismopedia glauca CCAP 1448/3]
MTLELKYFDTRLNRWVRSDNDLSNKESLITEKLDNTLLEFFLPEKDFSFGAKDIYGKPEDLYNHPDGDCLLLSSKSRLLYGSPDCLETIEKLCPDRKDRGAYGSVFIGACDRSLTEKLNVLIVDDVTGENGNVIDKEQARRMTGDCYGQISPELYDRLTGRRGEPKYSLVQHRFGWREGDGTDSTYRFGKGELRPWDFSQIDYLDPENKPPIDLIIPLSSFKGSDKDNPLGATKPQIEPGLYAQNMWLGLKTLSQQGKTSISQVIPSFPNGLRDYLEQLEYKAQRLSAIQSDPRELAKLYVESYEARKAISISGDSANAATADIDGGERVEKEDPKMYQIIKADVDSGHFQLVETEKVRRELSDFVRKQWTQIATGYSVTFDRATIIPSKDLKEGEICVPWMEEGEDVLNFRSPFLNSNGMCVSRNKMVTDRLGPDGMELEGVILVSDETLAQIKERFEAIEAEEGVNLLKYLPRETESERQGRDFDGDCIGVARAKDFPNLALEAQQRNQLANAYNPTVKLQKESFYLADGSQPDFEIIAHQMSDSMTVGVINNQVTRMVALESEIEYISKYCSNEEKNNYIKQIAQHYHKLIQRSTVRENDVNKISISQGKLQSMQKIIELARTNQIDGAIAFNKQFYRNLIEQGCSLNQIAVDMFKSNRLPDPSLIRENGQFPYRNINYLKDKKSSAAYLREGIEVKGYSPTELIVKQTNNYFQENELPSRRIDQFANLFQDVEYTNQQRLAVAQVKQEFDRALVKATQLDRRAETQIGPSITLVTAKGTTFEIDNIVEYTDFQEILNAQKEGKELNLTFRLGDRAAQPLWGDRKPELLVINRDTDLPIGKVPSHIVKELNIQPHANARAKVTNIEPAISKDAVKALFADVYRIADEFRASIPCEELPAMAAAAWAISTTREDGSHHKKTSSFVFSTFTPEIVERLQNLQFKEFLVSNIDKSSNWQQEVEPGQQVHLEFRESTDPQRRDVYAGETRIGTVAETSAQLPIGTKATGTVEINEAATATGIVDVAGLPKVEFLIREVKKFDYSDQIFHGEAMPVRVANVSVGNKVKVALEGKILGEVDPASVKDLEAANYCQNGNLLKLKLESVGQGEFRFRYIIGTSPTGRQLKINRVEFGAFQEETFKDTDFRRLTLEVSPTQRKDAVLLGDKLLGTLHLKKDKEALKSLGLYGREFNVKLESNYTTLTVHIDPQSVKYPVKEYRPQAISAHSLADKLAHQIKDRPTMMALHPDDLALGTVTLAVDSLKEKTVEEYLTVQGIVFDKIDGSVEEKNKGITVYGMVKDTISPEIMMKMEHRFGVSPEGYAEQIRLTPDRPQHFQECSNRGQGYLVGESPKILELEVSVAEIREDARDRELDEVEM